MPDTTIRAVDLDAYTFDPNNPNKGTDEGRALVQESIDEVGAGRSIVVAADNTVMAGNKTLQAARAAGIQNIIEVETRGDTLVAVKRMDWVDGNDPKAREYSYFDNRAGQVGLLWDAEQVLRDLRAGMKLNMFDKETLATLAHRGRRREQKAQVKDDEQTDYTAIWHTEPGQIWQMGDSRLIIGDCSDANVLSALFGEYKANLLVTSPPYWVGKVYESQKSEEEISEFIDACCDAWVGYVSPSFGRIVINTGTCAIHKVETNRPVEVLPLIDWWAASLKASGWLLRHMRLWTKSSEMAAASVSPKTDAVSSGGYEYILTFHTDDFEHMAVFWEPEGAQRGQNQVREPWAQLQVWSDIPGERSAGGHVAAFPVELPSRYIRMYTKPDEVVFDPFSGSGTTILACQQLGRIGFAAELDPNYAGMSLSRFQDETGITPTLI